MHQVYELNLDPVGKTLDAWSSTRIQFPPKGESIQFRSELREALRELRSSPDNLLAATYESAVGDVCDIENVLMYDVGTSAFSHLGVVSVHLRRVTRLPAPAPSGTNYPHHVRYELLRPRRLHPAPLVQFETAEFRAVIPGEKRQWAAWEALKRGRVDASQAIHSEARLAIRVAIDVPGRVRYPLNLVKAILDGIIAAMHSHDGSALGDVSLSVATILGMPQAEIGRLLLDESMCSLGRRRLVWVRAGSVQMNPADDRFDEMTVEFNYPTDAGFRARGEIFIAE